MQEKDILDKVVYFPIETTARELDARLLLAHRALARGYTVVLGRRGYVKQFAEHIGHGIYLDKGHNIHKTFPIHSVERKFCKAAIDEEGLVFLNDRWLINRSRPERLHQLDIVFAWGEYQKNVIARDYPQLEKNMYIVGNPRFDLLRPEFSPLYSNSKFISSFIRRPYILINTNFAASNLNSLYKDNYIELNKQYGRIESDEDIRFWNSREKYYKQLFIDYVEMIKKISSHFPQIQFVLRPHPSEDVLSWKQQLRCYKNVTVILKGGIVDWISNALAVIHTGCTTGIESWALNKVVLRYNSESIKGFESPLPNKFGYNCTSIDVLKSRISMMLNGEIAGTFKEQIGTAKPFIDSIDESRLSSDKMIDVFETVEYMKDSKKNVKDNIKRIDDMKGRLKFGSMDIIRYLRLNQVKFLSGFFSYILPPSFQKFSGLNKLYIQKRLGQFGAALQEKNPSYTVKKVASGTYVIHITS